MRHRVRPVVLLCAVAGTVALAACGAKTQQHVVVERLQYRRQGRQAGRVDDRRPQLGLRRRLARGAGSRDQHQRRGQPEPHELDLRPAHRAARGRQARARPGERLQVLQRRQDLHAHHPPGREVLRRHALHRPGGGRPHQQGPEVPVHLPADVAGQVRDGLGQRRGHQLHHRLRAGRGVVHRLQRQLGPLAHRASRSSASASSGSCRSAPGPSRWSATSSARRSCSRRTRRTSRRAARSWTS